MIKRSLTTNHNQHELNSEIEDCLYKSRVDMSEFTRYYLPHSPIIKRDGKRIKYPEINIQSDTEEKLLDCFDISISIIQYHDNVRLS